MEIYWCEFMVELSLGDTETVPLLDHLVSTVTKDAAVLDMVYSTNPAEGSVRFGMSVRVTAEVPAEMIPARVVGAIRAAIVNRGVHTLGWPEPVTFLDVNMQMIAADEMADA